MKNQIYLTRYYTTSVKFMTSGCWKYDIDTGKLTFYFGLFLGGVRELVVVSVFFFVLIQKRNKKNQGCE
jgi:hypothetical protein